MGSHCESLGQAGSCTGCIATTAGVMPAGLNSLPVTEAYEVG